MAEIVLFTFRHRTSTAKCRHQLVPSAEFIFFFLGDRNEQGLTEFLPKVTDHILSFRRDHEIGDGFSADGVDARTVGGIDFHHGVDIQASLSPSIRIRKLTLSRKGLTPLRKAK